MKKEIIENKNRTYLYIFFSMINVIMKIHRTDPMHIDSLVILCATGNVIMLFYYIIKN
jgi:hypothetical protein